MFKLNLKYISSKDNCHYFVVNNSEVLTEEYHNYEVDHDKYYPFLKVVMVMLFFKLQINTLMSLILIKIPLDMQ